MSRISLRKLGTVHVQGDGPQRFLVQAQPHIRMRMKRLFARSEGMYGDLTFLVTDESCRDLQWFVERYPLEFTPEAKAVMDEGAASYEKRTSITAKILAGRYKPKKGWYDMELPPRKYQEQAAVLCLNTRVLLVADDLGLGKTVTGLAILRDQSTLPAVVVCPPHLESQWEREICRFLPDYIVKRAKTGTPKEFDPFPDVLVISYYKLRGWSDHLGEIVQSVIFDEAQELRRSDSAKWAAAAHLASRADPVCSLSATPIYNYGSEIFSVYQAMRPGLLGTWDEFTREWCNRAMRREKTSLKDPEAFGTYLRDAGLMIRRTRLEVGRELPALSTVVDHISADLDALKAAEDSALALARVILDQKASTKQRFVASGQLDAQVRHATGVAKAPYVAAFVDMLMESGEPLVLFGWHRDVYGIWEERLAHHNPAWFTGSESTAKKRAEVERFIGGKTKLIVISLRAGSGLDGLQKVCSRVVFGELDWSPGVLEQCTGRVHRDGQQEPVFAYYPISEAGSDPIMVDVLGIKRQQIEGLRDPDGDPLPIREVDPDHIRKLAEEFVRRAQK